MAAPLDTHSDRGQNNQPRFVYGVDWLDRNIIEILTGLTAGLAEECSNVLKYGLTDVYGFYGVSAFCGQCVLICEVEFCKFVHCFSWAVSQ